MKLSTAALMMAALASGTTGGGGGGASAFVAPNAGRRLAAAAAATPTTAPTPTASSSAVVLSMADADATADADIDTTTTEQQQQERDPTSLLSIPLSFDEMIRDASSSMSDAYDAGVTRQMLRVLLPRDPTNDQLGQYFENDADTDTLNLVLAPPDETWQGGIMQLYRAAAPTCMEILRRFSKGIAGVPPKIVEDRSVDDSGVDGVGLIMTQSTSPSDDVCAFVQPTQETIDSIQSLSDQAGKDRLVALVNPQWRNADDALDAASKGGGVWGGVASFLGGKGKSLERLDDMGFREVYTLEGYVVKGGNIRMVKRFDTQWAVFAENDAMTDFIKVGTSEARPTYQEIDKMLDDKGIALKYARDIGLAPKLE